MNREAPQEGVAYQGVETFDSEIDFGYHGWGGAGWGVRFQGRFNTLRAK